MSDASASALCNLKCNSPNVHFADITHNSFFSSPAMLSPKDFEKQTKVLRDPHVIIVDLTSRIHCYSNSLMNILII